MGSFSDLLTRADLKGRITLLSEMRDTMGFMLKIVGADPRDFTDDEWDNAIDELHKAVRAGQVRAFTGNEYIQDLTAGNIAACEAWSGDVIQAQFDNPDIKFVVPEEGLSLWSDNMIVPNLADPPGQRRGLDQLLLRARGRREARGVGQLHLPGQGRPGGDGEDRPVPGRQRADLPDEESLANTFDFMPLTDQQQTAYEGDCPMSQVAESSTGASSPPGKARSTASGCGG